MKNIISFVFFVLFSINAFAGYGPVYVPSDYSLVSRQEGIDIYKHKYQNTYAMRVDVIRSNFDFSGTMGSAGTDSRGHNLYYTGNILDQWNLNSYNLSQPVFMVNGSFFSFDKSNYIKTKNYTFLSYPVKGNFKSLSSLNTDPTFPLRNLVINSSGKAYFNDGFDIALFNKSTTKEFMTGLIPSKEKSPTDLIGRNYIGGLPSMGCYPDAMSINCSMDYLVFFISFSSTHENMLTQMNNWKIPQKSRIMMDGSGSTQLLIRTSNFNYTNNGTGDDIFGSRNIANTILVGNK